MAPETWTRLWLAAATMLFAAVLALWAVLTPGFRTPDEPQHLNSVIRVLNGGGWPAPGEAVIHDGVRVAMEEAGWVPSASPVTRQQSSTLPRGDIQLGNPDFVGLDPGDPADRSVILGTDPLPEGHAPPATDQMTQHPPAYYLVAATVLRVLGADDWRWDQQLLTLRLLGGFLVMWVLPLTFVVVRNLGGSRRAAVVGATALIAVPQLAHISAGVTNDSLTNLMGASILACASFALQRRHTVWLVLITGCLLGIGLLTKGFLLAAIPVVMLAFLLGRRANPSTVRRLASAVGSIAIAFVIGGWWWLRNIAIHGTVQPDGMAPRDHLGENMSPEVGYFVSMVRHQFLYTSWGNFGWLEMQWPQYLSELGTAAVLFTVVAALVLHRGHRVDLLVVLLLPALTLAIVLYGSYSTYAEAGYVAGLQGRYLFVGAAALAASFGIAMHTLTRPMPWAIRTTVQLLALVIALTMGGYGLFFGFQGFYQLTGETITAGLGRWEAWSLLGRAGLALVSAIAALSGLATAACGAAALASPAPDLPRPAVSSAVTPRHHRGFGETARAIPGPARGN